MTRVDVLLLDAEYRQTFAAMCAYVRDGLRVGVVACESEAWWAPSLKSRHCQMRAVVPDFGVDPHAYVDALAELLDQRPANLVVPAHDGSIAAIRKRRSEIEGRAALPLASESALEIAVDKTRTLALAAELGIAVPEWVPVVGPEDAAAALQHVGLPAVIKPHASWMERPGHGVRLTPYLVQSVDEARRRIQAIVAAGGHAMLQQWLQGRREAVSLFYARVRMWARLAQVSHREWPVLGGASVLCETIPLLPDITEPAERLVRAMDLEGCSMVEFRRDCEGRPRLMEVNPRMAGSLSLALRAGVNFPRLAYDWKLGRDLSEVRSYQIGRRLRWLSGDIWNLKSVLAFQGEPEIPAWPRGVASFVGDFFRPSVTLDGVDPRDPRPALSEMNKLVVRRVMRRTAKALSFE